MAHRIVSETQGTSTDNGYKRRDILVEGESDLAKLPEDTAPGSIAHTAGYAAMWEKSIAGKWVKFGG